jgi:hypothetical protein
MRSLHSLFLLAFLTCAVAAYQQTFSHTSQQQPVTPRPQTGANPPANENPNQEINNRFVQQLLAKIAGRENEPAEQVFKNIQWLKGIPAGRLLRIMNMGYSRALGVSCTHCHVEQDFSSDDKRPKRAAREMADMHRMINEQLKKMQNLQPKTQVRAINCSTCHRGNTDPMAGG